MSTDVSRPLRGPRQLERAPHDPLDLDGWYSQRVEDGAVVRDAARAVVEAADELAHDQQVDRPRRGRAQVRVHVELAPRGRSGPASERAARRPLRPRRSRRAARRRPRGRRRASRPAAGSPSASIAAPPNACSSTWRRAAAQRSRDRDRPSPRADPVAGQADDATACWVMEAMTQLLSARSRT